MLPGKADDFSINRQEQFLKLYKQLTGALYGMAVGVGLITLIVGGIGIMNIMLVSVHERTREIGVRRALGARRSTILMQFLIESAVVAALGGAVGTAVGLGVAVLVALLSPLAAAVTPSAVVFGHRLLDRHRAPLRHLAGLAGRQPRSGGGAALRMRGFADNLGLAFSTLRGNPLRSLLTLLGIVIGAATVVAMMSLVEGFRISVNKDLAMLGAGSFQVQKWPAAFGHVDWRKYAKRRDLTREQGEALAVAAARRARLDRGVPPTGPRERSPPATAPPSRTSTSGAACPTTRTRTASPSPTADSSPTATSRWAGGWPSSAPTWPTSSSRAVGRWARRSGSAAGPFDVVGVAERRGSTLGGSQDGWVLLPIDQYYQVRGKVRTTTSPSWPSRPRTSRRPSTR